MSLVAMITGHRPNKLGGYGPSDIQSDVRTWMRAEIAKLLAEDSGLSLISGMALGVDTWWAEEGIALGVPVHAYVPFSGQESAWPAASQQAYRDLLARCSAVTIICEGGYAAQKMQRRNETMVRDANRHYAVWDGTAGGTANCVSTIRQRGLPVTFYPGLAGANAVTEQDDPRHAGLLEHFAPPARSHVTNLFLAAMRADPGRAWTPTEVCRATWIAVAERNKERGEDDRSPAPAFLPIVMRANREQALDFAAWCIEWEGLSPEMKTKAKNARFQYHAQRGWG